MRRLIMVLGAALLLTAATRPATAQEGREARAAHSDYWIGVMFAPVDEALRAQLQLGEGVSLLAAEIVPDSPAARAGLKKFDVVTGVGGRPLRTIGQLMEAVDAAGDRPLKLDFYRNGKSQTVEVTPTERPRGDVLRRFDLPLPEGRTPPTPEELRDWAEKMRKHLPEGEARRIQEWVERMQRGETMPFRMHVFGPGVVMHQAGGEPLPKGVSVTIKKTGDQPTEIRVERGDERWDLKENELEKLPPDLRGPVGAMLGGGGAHAAVMAVPGAAAGGVVIGTGEPEVKIEIDGKPATPGTIRSFTLPVPQPPHGGPAGPELEALKQQVERLQRQVEELQKSQSGPAKKEPEKKKTKT